MSLPLNVLKFPDNRKFNKYNNRDGGGSDMEARVARLESDVENIKTNITDIKQDIRGIRTENRSDFRILFGSLITVALGLAWLMAKGFGWL